MPQIDRIVVLTGAGLSAESGLSTFRDAGGIWEKYDLNEVATPQGFAENPELVHSFYNARRRAMRDAKPNAAHFALMRLERECGAVMVTQNVDDLLERAGCRNVLHMHGELSGALCDICGFRWPAPDEMRVSDCCPQCRQAASRPDVVWFEEYPYHIDRIYAEIQNADLFASIGTSGQVSPANTFLIEAKNAGARTVELNLERTSLSGMFDNVRLGPATEFVPAWVDEFIAEFT